MSNTIDSYDRYLRTKKIINMVSRKECSVEYIIKKTKFPHNTIYRIINLLLKHNVITARATRSKKYNHRHYQVFKIKSRRNKRFDI